ncbi:hypothetical protein GQ44DRAFT_780231 [Phaeosphaeriaceae sp. PMI808]|nr:hypothetical protein GQ44DRAFT_780231 [Phaeosphaeriaceae sp. PMI808]
MVAPVPGLPSFGDIVRAVEIVSQGVKVLKACGDIDSDYEQSMQFLECVHITVKEATDHVANEPNSAYAEGLRKNLELIVLSWTEFHEFLKKYESALATGARPQPTKKALKSLRFAMKEVRGQLDSFKLAVALPLGTALFTISLHSLQEIKQSSFRPLTTAQVNQITQATELVNQFASLQLLLGNVNQDTRDARAAGRQCRVLLETLKEDVLQLRTSIEYSFRKQSDTTSTAQAELIEEIKGLKIRLEALQVVVGDSRAGLNFGPIGWIGIAIGQLAVSVVSGAMVTLYNGAGTGAGANVGTSTSWFTDTVGRIVTSASLFFFAQQAPEATIQGDPTECSGQLTSRSAHKSADDKQSQAKDSNPKYADIDCSAESATKKPRSSAAIPREAVEASSTSVLSSKTMLGTVSPLFRASSAAHGSSTQQNAPSAEQATPKQSSSSTTPRTSSPLYPSTVYTANRCDWSNSSSGSNSSTRGADSYGCFNSTSQTNSSSRGFRQSGGSNATLSNTIKTETMYPESRVLEFAATNATAQFGFSTAVKMSTEAESNTSVNPDNPETLWYCCQCHDGPFSTAIYVACPCCDHIFHGCQSCQQTVQTVVRGRGGEAL